MVNTSRRGMFGLGAGAAVVASGAVPSATPASYAFPSTAVGSNFPEKALSMKELLDPMETAKSNLRELFYNAQRMRNEDRNKHPDHPNPFRALKSVSEVNQARMHTEKLDSVYRDIRRKDQLETIAHFAKPLIATGVMKEADIVNLLDSPDMGVKDGQFFGVDVRHMIPADIGWLTKLLK
jgi:hypothetical protein